MTRNEAAVTSLWAATARECKHRNGSGGAANTDRSLTHSLDYREEGLAMQPTQDNPAPGRAKRLPRFVLTAEQLTLFWARVDKQPDGGCWIWRGSINERRGGYGTYSANGWTYRTHVLAYTLTVGPVPPGLQLDHVRARGCTRTDCVNPAHLEPVTNRENTIRGRAPDVTRQRHEAQTRCKNNHPLTGRNLLILKRGTPREQRGCRTCANDSAARYRERKYAERGPVQPRTRNAAGQFEPVAG